MNNVASVATFKHGFRPSVDGLDACVWVGKGNWWRHNTPTASHYNGGGARDESDATDQEGNQAELASSTCSQQGR